MNDLEYARHYNQQTWALMDKANRSAEEDLLVITYAHTSLAHWLVAGSQVEKTRAYWLVSRASCLVEDKRNALLYARLCDQFSQEHAELMKDFDMAYAAEALARALALNGEMDQAQDLLTKAEMLGNLIANEEDRVLFQKDLVDGNWFGLVKPRYKFCHG